MDFEDYVINAIQQQALGLGILASPYIKKGVKYAYGRYKNSTNSQFIMPYRSKPTGTIKKMKRQIAMNKSEVKMAYKSANALNVVSPSVSPIELTNIPQGDDNDQRVGRRIRILSVDIRCYVNRNIDIYLVKSYLDEAPDINDFSLPVGGHLD